MNSNAVCILANNIFYLENILKNININRKYDIIIINETRIGNKVNTVQKLIQGFKNAIVLDSRIVLNEFECIVNNDFVEDYSMGMNILAQWFLFKKYNYEKILFCR